MILKIFKHKSFLKEGIFNGKRDFKNINRLKGKKKKNKGIK